MSYQQKFVVIDGPIAGTRPAKIIGVVEGIDMAKTENIDLHVGNNRNVVITGAHLITRTKVGTVSAGASVTLTQYDPVANSTVQTLVNATTLTTSDAVNNHQALALNATKSRITGNTNIRLVKTGATLTGTGAALVHDLYIEGILTN